MNAVAAHEPAPLVAPATSRKGVIATLAYPLKVGPYRFAAHFTERSAMRPKRALVDIDVNAQELRFDAKMGPSELAPQFFQALVRVIHNASGCREGCPEETYTHSFASGFVAFALNNPQAWMWFNQLLAQATGRPSIALEALGRNHRQAQLPKQMYLFGRTILRGELSERLGKRMNAWAFYDCKTHEVRMDPLLQREHLAVVFVHELTHAVHHAYELDDGDKHTAFVRAQARGWLSFI